MSIRGSEGGGHTIEDEGISLTQRIKLNFVGDGVVVTDDLGNDASKVTISGGGGGTTTKTVRIPLVPLPEGTVGIANLHVFATQGSRKSGFVLPDGASVGKFNGSCIVPDDLATIQNASLKFYIYTLGALVDKDVRLKVSSRATADGENGDQAFTVETEQTVRMPNTIESLDIYDQALTDTLVAGDELGTQLERDPTDALDNADADILVKGFLEIDVTN